MIHNQAPKKSKPNVTNLLGATLGYAIDPSLLLSLEATTADALSEWQEVITRSWTW